MSLEKWEMQFRSDSRKAGKLFCTQNSISVSRPSDSEIKSYVNGSKCVLLSSLIDTSITAQCTCAQFRKGLFCKHIWATLLATEGKYSDFLVGKKELEKKISISKSRDKFKNMQTEYRKLQYKAQKERNKNLKSKKNNLIPKFPKVVETALNFFDSNGFKLEFPLKAEAVQIARKKLSRIFHPDIGGSHDEIVELNKNFEILIAYSDTK